MTIAGIGTDIVSLERVRKARYPERLAEFVFRDEELVAMRASRDMFQFIGSRFAAKEAVIKAFPGVLHYHDFVIIARQDRTPDIRFLCDFNPEYKVFLSLTHEYNYALACAILTYNE